MMEALPRNRYMTYVFLSELIFPTIQFVIGFPIRELCTIQSDICKIKIPDYLSVIGDLFICILLSLLAVPF